MTQAMLVRRIAARPDIVYSRRPIDIGTELTLVHAVLCNDVSARSHEGGWAGALVKLTRRFASAAG